MSEAQNRVTTGLRVSRASDDPAATVGIMAADRKLHALDQYRKNIDTAQSRLGSEEQVLDQVTDLLDRARELGVNQGGSGTATATTRLQIKAEVDKLLDQMVTLGNTRFGNGFLFGGDYADQAPFSPTGTTSVTAPPTGVHVVEINDGQSVAVNHDGLQVFVSSGAFQALQDLSTGLGNNSDTEISNALGAIDTSFGDIQDILAETGARRNQLDMAASNIDALDVNLRSFRSTLSDAELEESISQLVARQTAYQAALMSTSRIISQSLTDYLR
jgi:flagellar hook-associated protein 3 FlgL